MRNIYSIFKKELISYFNSPIAYVVLTVFLLLTGYFFISILSFFIQYTLQSYQSSMQYGMQQNINVNMMMLRPYFHNLVIIIIFMIPIITMRLVAEEKKTGTMELLMTSPITPIQWILGKYFAGFGLFFIMITFSFIPVFLLFIFGNPEFWPVMTGYLGLLLVGGALISVGLVVSSLTENQIIAAAVTFSLCLILLVIDWLANFLSYAPGLVLKNLSIISRFDEFTKGVFDTKHFVFFVSFIIFGIFLTYRSIDSIRWRM